MSEQRVKGDPLDLLAHASQHPHGSAASRVRMYLLPLFFQALKPHHATISGMVGMKRPFS